MKIHNLCLLYAVNSAQYKRLMKIERRTAKLTGHKIPCSYLLSAFFQPIVQDQTDRIISEIETLLDKKQKVAYDPEAIRNSLNK